MPLGRMFTGLVAVPLMKVPDPRQQVGRHQQGLLQGLLWAGSPAGCRGVGCHRRLEIWSFPPAAGASKQGKELQQGFRAAGTPLQ
jgi:hypothetical protein